MISQRADWDESQEDYVCLEHGVVRCEQLPECAALDYRHDTERWADERAAKERPASE